MANILVVDDELGIRDLLSEILFDEGHQVELAENAAQARAARQNMRPDLVLLDIHMPGATGFDLLARQHLVTTAHLNAAVNEADAGTPLRAAMFLAQLAHESGQFRYMEEIWGPTDAQRRYEPPGALASRLGNTERGDGFRFKGRGPDAGAFESH